MHMLRPLAGILRRRLVPALLLPVLLPLLPAAHAAAANVTVTTFYATTKQADDNWAKTNYAPPPRVTAFPAGTIAMAFYFAYSGASKSSGYYLVLRKHHGATIDVLGWYKLATGSSSNIGLFNPGTSYANGAYDVDLVIDDHRMATITVMVGGAGAGGGGGGGGGAGGVSISAFYPVGVAAMENWAKQNFPTLKPVTSYPAGSTYLAFYFAYKGATAKATRYRVMVKGPHGLKVADKGPYTLSYTSGRQGDYVGAPQGLAFPSGSYTAVLLIDKQQAAQATFSVG